MRLFWWQHLPLLIFIQFSGPRSTSHFIYAEAFLACQSVRVGRFPCIIERACLHSYRPNDRVFSFSLFPSGCSVILREKCKKSRNPKKATSVGGNDNVPTLTPLQQADNQKPKKRRFTVLVGGVTTTLLVIIILVLVYICLMRVKRFMRGISERDSFASSPSVVELESRVTPLSNGLVSSISTQKLRRLSMLELKHATSDFSPSNIIGESRFGLVYRGLLQDGSIVAIKRRLHTPIHNFIQEVKRIGRVNHINLVKLVGFCDENHQELLVYDYIPCGSVSNHLYGFPTGKLNMRQRLLIALGAAKGLEHLHNLVPPLFHTHFRSSNVLLDETLNPKISDYGLSKLVANSHHASSSSSLDCFLDPELNVLKNFTAKSDVYSFGVFLLELISGQDANNKRQPDSVENLVLQAKRSSNLDNVIDKVLEDQAIDIVRPMMELALQCVDIGLRRPPMRRVVEEIEHIQAREIGHLCYEKGEEIGAVTLGSDLFK